MTLLLGSFLYLPLVLILPPVWAVAAAEIALLPTLAQFGDPFVLTIGMLESLWLVLGRRYSARHPATLDFLFWVCLGMPGLLAMELYFAGAPLAFAWLVVAKVAINQWAAVITAHFAVRHTPFGRWLDGRGPRRERLRDLVFDYAFALALVPLLLVGAGMTVMLRRLTENSDRQVLTATAQRVSQQLDLFLREHVAIMDSVARLSGQNSTVSPFLLEEIRRTHPEFITLIATDRNGLILVAAPANRLRQVAGTSVADREYFRAAERNEGPFVSPVFRGRGFGSDILVAVSAPRRSADGAFAGVVEASLEVRRFGEAVVAGGGIAGAHVVIADPTGRVIYADPATNLHALANLRYDAVGPLLSGTQAGGRFVFERRDLDGRRRFFVAYAARSRGSGLLVIAERPIGAALAEIAWIYYLIGAVLAGITGASVMVARAAARRLSQPLEYFAESAAAQAERSEVQPIGAADPATPQEFAEVFAAFNRLAEKVRESHQALRQQNSELDRRVAERTRQLEAACEAAENANQSKSEFIARTSHEIRTPLNAIIGMTDVMAANAEDPATVHRLRTISEAGRGLLTVTNDLLDLSKIEAGKLEISATAVDLAALCREVHTLLALRAAERAIGFHCTVESPLPPWARTDPGRLRQVLLNLLGNALKFTRHGEVRLALAVTPVDADTLSATFRVSDTGPGIAPAEQSQLFQPYVQLAHGRQNGAAGTGLGLAISRHLVDLLGGTLQLESRLGEGSTFHFTLRLARTAPAAAAAPEPAPPAAAPRAQHVLVADDNIANQEVMRAMLEPMIEHVSVVASAADAIATLQRERFDVAFIDLEMPDADGFTVAHAVRSWSGAEASRECRLVAFSAYPREQVLARCQAGGFTDFLSKPIVRRELTRLLEPPATAAPRTA